MAGRPLTPEEAALWRRVMAGVTPLAPRTKATLIAPGTPQTAAKPRMPVATPAPPLPLAVQRPASRKRSPAVTITPAGPPPLARATLDGSWDRNLARGLVTPDRSIDLHGHTLATAYRLLDDALAHAIARGERVILLVTGKPPRPDSERPHARGAIRAAVHDWLAASRHADAIAAVRGAAPRHGGAGALYIILKKPGTARNY